MEERLTRSSFRVRRAFDEIVARLASDPGLDYQAIYDNFLTPNVELRLYLDSTFLVTFAVQGDRVLIIDFVHTLAD